MLSWSFGTSCIWLNMPFFVHAEIYPQTPSQFYHQGYFRTWHNCLACKFNKWINKQKKGVKTLQKSFSPALAETFSTKIFDIAFWWVFLSIVYCLRADVSYFLWRKLQWRDRLVSLAPGSKNTSPVIPLPFSSIAKQRVATSSHAM